MTASDANAPAVSEPWGVRTSAAAADEAVGKDKRVPLGLAPLPFTLADLKRAIPKRCFERSVWRSLSYLLVDLVVISALFLFATHLIDPLSSTIAASLFPSATTPLAGGPTETKAVFDTAFLTQELAQTLVGACLWVVYWVAQGCVMTGVWVIAHECGHGAFSAYEWVNDTVGLVLHSALLVPYFSWKFSHARHHSKTGNMDYDEVFVPEKKQRTDHKAEAKEKDKAAEAKERPKGIVEELNEELQTVLYLVVMLTVGWLSYLFFNVSSRDYSKAKNLHNRKLDVLHLNHFHPYSPIFRPKEAKFVLLSDLALVLALGSLVYFSWTYSFTAVAKLYLVPYLIVNFWLTLITKLQHTDEALPHFDDEKWVWLKGALCTVDRDYGLLNHVFHHIGDTHVAHHLFSKMPHYHAEEATRAIKPLLGKYYRMDDTPIFGTLWRVAKDCQLVDEDPAQRGVYWFK
ncbi:Delta(12)-fatty-acid desaturase [Balamuthia mandrillaris]